MQPVDEYLKDCRVAEADVFRIWAFVGPDARPNATCCQIVLAGLISSAIPVFNQRLKKDNDPNNATAGIMM